MGQPIRLGIVGSGPRGISVGRRFAAHRDCEITALMDPAEGQTRRAAEALELGEVWEASSYEQVLDQAPVDALFFACDPLVQVDFACRAMERGFDVCTEVPAAVTLEECWRLVETAEQTGRIYQLMEQISFSGYIEQWRNMRVAGELGHVCVAYGEYIHYQDDWNFWVDADTGESLCQVVPPSDRRVKPSWRLKLFEDPILYLPHTLGPLLTVLDDRVERVTCMGNRPESHTFAGEKLAVRDASYALMHTEKDTVLVVGAGFTLPGVRRRDDMGHHWYELKGTKASVESPRDQNTPFREWRPGMSAYEARDWSVPPLDASEDEKASGHGGRDFKPVLTFIDAVKSRQMPPMNVYRAVETAAPAILARDSARNGGEPRDVPDFRRHHKA